MLAPVAPEAHGARVPPAVGAEARLTARLGIDALGGAARAQGAPVGPGPRLPAGDVVLAHGAAVPVVAAGAGLLVESPETR